MDTSRTCHCVNCKGRYSYSACSGDALFCPECRKLLNRAARRRIEKMILKIRGQKL